MSSIDERIVEMQFNNQQFEEGIQTSLKSIDNLKKGLQFEGATDGFSDINAAAGKVSFNPITTGLSAASQHFSAFEVMAITALSNITNKAVDAAERMVKSLSIDQVTAGWSKYGQKTEGVATIMAATGENIDTVNNYLQKLIWYSDETSYSFTDMVSSIGKFTSSGMNLGDSVTAMEGIANWAALSGTNAQKASSAYYNLSQAIGAGALRLQDYRSLQNIGMDTQEFRQTCLDTAVALGQLTKSGEDAYKTLKGHEFTKDNFTSLLSESWLSTEVMMEVFKKYGSYADAIYEISDQFDTCADAMKGYTGEIDDLGMRSFKAAQEAKTFGDAIEATKDAVSSGWMTTFEILFGNYEQAKIMWTDLANLLWDVFASGGDARNDLLEEVFTSNWSKLNQEIANSGGSVEDFDKALADLLTKTGHDVTKLKSEYGSLENAFKEGAVSSHYLKMALKSLQGEVIDLSDLTENLKMGDAGDDVKKVQEILKSLDYDLGTFGADGKFGEATEQAVKAFQEAQGLKVTGIIDEDTIKALEEATVSGFQLNDEITDLIDNITELGGRDKILQGLANIWGVLVRLADSVKLAFRQIFPEMDADSLMGIIDRFVEFTSTLRISSETARDLTRTFRGVFSVVDIFSSFISAIGKGAYDLITYFVPAGKSLLKFTGNMGMGLNALRDWIKENDLFNRVIGYAVNLIERFITGIPEFFNELKELPEVQRLLGNIQSILEKLPKSASAFIDALMDVPLINKAVSALETQFPEVFDFFRAVVRWVTAFKTELQGLDEITLDGIIEAFSHLKDRIKTYFMIKFGDMNGFSGSLKDALLNAINNALGVFNDFGAWAKEKIGSISWDKILKFALGLSVLIPIGLAIKTIFGTIFSILSILKRASDMFKQAKELFGNLNGLVKEAKTGQKLRNLDSIATSLLKFAGAIGIIALSVSMLSKLDPNSVASAATTLGLLIATMSAMIIAFGVLEKRGLMADPSKTANSFLVMSAAIWLIAHSLKVLGDMELSGLEDRAILLGAIMAGLTGMLIALNRFGGPIQTSAVTILAIAFSLNLIVYAFKSLTEIDINGIQSAIIGMITIVASLSVLMIVASKVGTGASGTGRTILAMAAGILLMSFALKIVSGIETGDLVKGIIALAAMEIMIIALSKVNSKLSTFSKMQNGVKFGPIISMCAGIFMLAVALKMVGTMSAGDLIKGVATIAVLELLVMAMISFSKAVGKTKGGIKYKPILAMCAGILMLSYAVKMLSDLTPEQVFVGVAAIAAMELLVAGMVVLSKVVGKVKGVSMRSVLGMSAGILILATAVKMLSGITAAGILKGVVAIGALSAIMVAMMNLTAGIKGGASTKFLILSGSIAILAGVMVALAQLPVENLAAATIAIAALGGITAALIYATKFLDASALGKVLLLDLMVAGIAVVLYALASLPSTDVLNIAQGLSEVLLALSVASIIISHIPIAGAIEGILGLGVIIGGLTIALAALGGLSKIPGLKELMGAGGDFLKTIGSAIGGFVGSIVSGFTDAATSNLPELGTRLSLFMTNLQPFLDAVGGVDSGVVDSVGILANAMLELTAAQIFDGIANWFSMGTSMETFGEDLVTFGTYFKQFADAIDGVNTETITASANAAQALASLNDSLPAQGGVLQDWIGEKSLDGFGESLVSFADSMTSYSDAISGNFDAGAVTASANAAQALADLETSLPAEGGVLQYWLGSQSLTTFGDDMANFATGLVAYSNAISGNIDATAITDSANAAQLLGNLEGSLPQNGGVLQGWIGSQSLATFGDELGNLGTGLAAFSKAITENGGIDVDAISSAADASTKLSDLQSGLEAANGVVQWFEGEKDLGNFGSSLEEYGKGLKQFSDGISGDNAIDIEAINTAVEATTVLQNLTNTLDTMGGLVTTGNEIVTSMLTFTGNFQAVLTDLSGLEIGTAADVSAVLSQVADFISSSSNIKTSTDYSDTITKIGDAIKALDGVTVTNLSNTSSQLSSLQEVLQKLTTLELGNLDDIASKLTSLGSMSIDTSSATESVTTMMSNFTNSMNSASQSASSSASGMANGVISGMKSVFSGANFSSEGSKMMGSLVEAMQHKAGAVTSIAKSIVTNMTSAVRGGYRSMHDAGGYLDEGLAKGISGGASGVIEAAKRTMRAAVNAARSEGEIHSPSGVMMEVGKFWDMGFANGITQYAKLVSNASETAMSDSIESARTGLSSLGYMVNQDIDVNPTIRPVLDLSEIKAGASTIGGMFNTPTLGLANANIGSISTSMADFSQNRGNDEIISAIYDLGKQISRMPGTTYNVNGITYDDGTNVASAVSSLIRAARLERRV